MFSYKLMIQSLITVPKNLQLHTVATINNFFVHTCANIHNVICKKNCKNGTIRNISNNTGVGKENEICAKYTSLSIPLDVYKKIRKVNKNSQLTKNIHQRTKTNILHSKCRNLHQDIRRPLTGRNVNRICKHRPQVPQSSVRFISNHNSILPPPFNHDKNEDVPVDLDKISAIFNSTVPPSKNHIGNVIHDQSKDLLESSFNITITKGRKVRPSAGTEKRCMSSSRILKVNTLGKLIDFGLLQKRENLPKSLKNLIHTTQSLTDVKEFKSIAKLNNMSKSINEIYNKQSFVNQPSSYRFYNTYNDNVDNRNKPEFKTNRYFMKSYQRKVKLPPPTSKKMNMHTSNLSLSAANNDTSLNQENQLKNHYNFYIPKSCFKATNLPLPIYKSFKTPTLNSASPPAHNLKVLKNLIIENEKPTENVQLENIPLPPNYNLSASKGIHENIQENTFKNNSYNYVTENKECPNYMMDGQMTNENRYNFNNNGNTETAAVNDNYTVDMENKNHIEKSVNNYNINCGTVPMSKDVTNVFNQNNSLNAEYQQHNLCTDASLQAMNNNTDFFDSEEKQENKLETPASSACDNNNSLPKNDEPTQIKIHPNESGTPNTYTVGNVYNENENQENKYNCQASNMNDKKSTEKNDSGVDKIYDSQENKIYFQTLPNMNNAWSSENGYVNQMGENQENNVNTQTSNEINNTMDATSNNNDCNVYRTDVNKQANMNNMSTEKRDSLYGMDENQQHLEPSVNNNNNYNQYTELNYYNNLPDNKSRENAYFKTSYFINSNIVESPNNNKYKYEDETPENEVKVQTSREMNNTMETMNNNFPRTNENQYFDEMSKIESNLYNEMYQQTNRNITSNMDHSPRSSEIRRPKESFGVTVEPLKQKSFATNLWKKFIFPAPSAPTNDEFNIKSIPKPMKNGKNIPIFHNFIEARNYFVEPENLKKLTPPQLAMYNSILYYEAVINKHSQEIERQRNNWESTRQAIKLRKYKFGKNKSNFYQ